MNPLFLAALGLGGGYLGFKAAKGGSAAITKASYQTMEGITPDGKPIKVAAPVARTVTTSQARMKVTKPSTKGQYSPVPTTVPGRGTTYAPPGTITTTVSGQITQPAPIVITKGGASSIAVGTVQDIQRSLNTLGYAKPPRVVDGKLGPKTAAAIKAYQSKNKLTVNGNASDTLRAALSASLCNTAGGVSVVGAVVQNGSPETGKIVTPAGTVVDTKAALAMSVKDVQYSLNGLGASPKLVVDGKSGPKTVAAIKSFQTAHGLVPDGIAGAKTKTALYQLYPPTPAGMLQPAVERRQISVRDSGPAGPGIPWVVRPMAATAAPVSREPAGPNIPWVLTPGPEAYREGTANPTLK